MEACMMKPEAKKKPKPRPLSAPPKPPEIRRFEPGRPEEPAPVLPPRPVDSELVNTQFRVKRLAAAFDGQANGNLSQQEMREKRSETPVVPPRSKAKELNSAVGSGQRGRSEAESSQGSAQPDRAVEPKDEADFKQSNQQGLMGIFRKSQKEKTPSFTVYKTHNLDEDEKGDDAPVKQAPSSKPGGLKGVMKGLQFKPSPKTSRDPSPDPRAEEASAEKEQSADKNRLGKNAEPKQEKGGFFSGILKKPNKPADGTSPRASRDPSPDPSAEEGGSEKEQTAEKTQQEKDAESKQEKGGFFSGLLKKTNKPAEDTPAQENLSVHGELSASSDSLSENKEKGNIFSGMFKKAPKPAESAEQDKESLTEKSASSENLSENSNTKEKGGVFSAMFKKAPKPSEGPRADEGAEPSHGDPPASTDCLSENKEKGGLFSGLLRKTPKAAGEGNLPAHKGVSGSSDNLADTSNAKEKKSRDDELSGSTEGLNENSTKEKGGIFSGIFKKPHKPAEAAQSEEDLSSDSELSASNENLSENKQEKGGGLFSGLRKKTPKASGDKTEPLDGEPQKELSASNDDLSENTGSKEKNIFSNMFKRPQKPAETESEGNAENQLSGSSENLTDTTAPKEKKGGIAEMFKRSASIEFDLFDEEGGGLFSGLLKKAPKASGDEEASEEKNSQRELSASTDNLFENGNTKEKNIFSGMFKKAQKPADEESGDERKLSASAENLTEGATAKEKTGGLAGLFKKSPKPAPRTITKQDPLSDLKRSESLDSLSDNEEESLSAGGEQSGSRENLAAKEKKGGFAGMFRRTPKNEEQQGGEDAEAPAGGGLRRKRTIKKKQRVVSFRVKKTLPRIPKLNLASQSSEKLPAVEETVELEELNPVQESTVEVQPVEMAAYPTEDARLQSELENNELIEWWNSVKGWTEWNETSNFGEEDEQMAMEQAADRVYMAARLFVHLFNQRGASLQHRILELLALADAADHFHKKTTTAAVGGGVASVAGSVTTITGLILAPFTFGASIIVTAVGIGVATAGSIASATANITDTVHSNMDRKKLEKMIQDYQEEIKDIRECMEFVQEGMDTLQDWDFEKYCQSAASKAMNHNIKHVMKEGGRAGKALMINTDKLISTVQVLGAAGGVAKAAQAISVTTGVMSALFLALDIFFLAKDSHKLRKGAKTKFASKIRDVCKDLQDGLLELNKVKTQLQKTMEGIEVEEYEEIEEVEVEVEDDLESDPKKLAELEQELDLLEEKLDKKMEEEQKKMREMESLKAKEKKEKSMKEKGELEEKEDSQEKADKDETKKDKSDSNSETKTESDEEDVEKKPKEEHSMEQLQRGSKKEKETENWITAGKHERKPDAIGDNSVMEQKDKTQKEPEVKSKGRDSVQGDRHAKAYSEWDKTERGSERPRRRSSREDEGVKPEWTTANAEREAASRSTRRHSSRSDREEERGGKHGERGGSRRSNRDSDRTESRRRSADEEHGAKDRRAEGDKGHVEWREPRETREDQTWRASHRSHEASTRREHSERERAGGRQESTRSHRSERGESRRSSAKTGGREEERETLREHGGSRRRGSDKDGEHRPSRRGSRPRSNALLDDGLYI